MLGSSKLYAGNDVRRKCVAGLFESLDFFGIFCILGYGAVEFYY